MTPAVGQSFVRKDGRAKVTGAAKYTADFTEPQLGYGIIVQSDIASGKIKDFDLSHAKKTAGVIEILTHDNAPSIHAAPAGAKPGTGDPQLPLQNTKIFYNGQPIALVIATTLEAAEQAAKLVQVRYHEDKAQLNFEEKRQSDKKKVKKDSNGRTATQSKGDVDKETKNAAVVVQRTYTLPIENHHPMELSSTLAVFQGEKLKVYESTQGVMNAKEVFTAAFKVKKDDVQIITKFVGGGFGCKGSVWTHALLAGMAAQKTKRPVKVVVTRTQMSTNVGYRACTVQDVTLASDATGKLKAIKHETVNPTSLNKDYPETTGALFKLLYDAPAISTTQNLVKLNYPGPTFMRAPGECSGSFALESAMDELAHELKIDPIKLRMINDAEKDPMKDIPFSSKSLKQCYEQAANKFEWSKRKAEPGANREGDYLIGHGMATSSYPVHFFSAKAKIELSVDGTAKVTSATQDLGTGTYTVMTQLAADALGLAYDKVNFDLGNSDYPKAGVSGGSSTVSSVGWAIDDASKKIIDQIKQIASKDQKSPLRGLKPDQLAGNNGKLFIIGEPGKNETYLDIMKRNNVTVLVGEGEMNDKEQKAHEKKYSSHSYGAQFVEVKVHALTGEVKLSRLVAAFAAGRIVNPLTAKNQFMGGIIFGIGMGLTEHNVVDGRTGKFMVRDLGEYHVPVNRDVPSLEIIMIDEIDTVVNPAGTKGIGEIGTVGTAAAIANAVFNATGIRVRDIPITPDKLVNELSKKV